MIRILCLVYNLTDSCSFYRAGGIFPDLAKKLKADIQVVAWSQIELHWQKIIEYDLIFMQRPFTSEALSMTVFMKNFNIPVWVDYDDNLFEVPAENKFSNLYNDEARSNIKQILKLADAVSVTTEALKDVYSEYSGNVFIIPNAFNDYIFTKRIILPERKPLAVWRGSDSHIFDIMTVGDALNKCTREFRDWEFRFVGFYPWYLEERKNLFSVPEMDVMFYFDRMYRYASSVLFAPLNDSKFNRCKSNIAYIEAAYFGAACLVPNFPEWNKPGALNYSDNDSFYEQIKRVFNKEIDVTGVNKLAWDYVTDELMLSKINLKRVELVESLLCQT